MQVVVVTPESYISREHIFPANAFTVVISQSGFSTNSIAALDFIRKRGERAVSITGNPRAPIAVHSDLVVDYGVGVESVDFVTMGVLALVEFLMLFALYAARAVESVDDARVELELDNLRSAIEAHRQALDPSASCCREMCRPVWSAMGRILELRRKALSS